MTDGNVGGAGGQPGQAGQSATSSGTPEPERDDARPTGQAGTGQSDAGPATEQEEERK